MTAFLDVVAGPHSGSSIPLTDGVFRLGRGVESSYVLAGDHFLSDVHFAVGARDNTHLLKDLGSLNGTFVNGLRVEQARLNDGDRILAGHSAFGLRIAKTAEGSSTLAQAGPIPPRQGWTGPHRSPQLTSAQNRAMDVLATQTGTLFAVLDAARDTRIPTFLQSQSGQFRSLFEGEKAQEYARVAPYLLLLSTAACEQLIPLSWHLSWGIYIHSPMTAEEVQHHLRNFLIAETPDEKRVLFRFYDPRVLRVYLSTCNPQEVASFFGNNYSFVMEDKLPGRWVCFERGAAGVKIDFALLEKEKAA
jgi:hypothetical protein